MTTTNTAFERDNARAHFAAIRGAAEAEGIERERWTRTAKTLGKALAGGAPNLDPVVWLYVAEVTTSALHPAGPKAWPRLSRIFAALARAHDGSRVAPMGLDEVAFARVLGTIQRAA